MASVDLWWTAPASIPDMETEIAARKHQARLIKPAGALGELENIAIQLAGLLGRARPSIKRPWITLFAADHGVAAENISAHRQAATAQMVHHFITGGASVNVLAAEQHAKLEVVDVGVIGEPLEHPHIIQAKIAQGTKNITLQPAMSQTELYTALSAGRRAARRAFSAGADLFIAGEAGVGNTTSASALICVFLKTEPDYIVGPGSGLSRAGIEHKAHIVSRALELHSATLAHADTLTVLQLLGGFEIVAMAGAYIACAQAGIPIMIDGFTSTTAALAAVLINPDIRPWMLFGHCSAEPAHRELLNALNAEPLLALGMRLGEGSGAMVALSLVRLACALHNNTATVSDLNMTDRQAS